MDLITSFVNFDEDVIQGRITEVLYGYHVRFDRIFCCGNVIYLFQPGFLLAKTVEYPNIV